MPLLTIQPVGPRAAPSLPARGSRSARTEPQYTNSTHKLGLGDGKGHEERAGQRAPPPWRRVPAPGSACTSPTQHQIRAIFIVPRLRIAHPLARLTPSPAWAAPTSAAQLRRNARGDAPREAEPGKSDRLSRVVSSCTFLSTSKQRDPSASRGNDRLCGACTQLGPRVRR